MGKAILYCYNYNFMNSNATNYEYKIIEVEEREKSFKLINHNDSLVVDCKRLLKKQDLNIIQKGYSTYYLFSDKPNGKLFKTFLKKKVEDELNSYKQKVEKLQNRLKNVDKINIDD